MKRFLPTLLALILLLVVALALGGRWWVGRSFPQTNGTLRLPGLDSPVDVRRDALGVPHIYASTVHDALFAQGVVHAQDRLWQMDFQRRVGQGRLSEMFGDATLETDRFLRTIGTHRAAQQDWEGLSAESKAMLTAYADGVNAYVATGHPLPLEYTLLRIGWEPWEPMDSLAWAKMMQWQLNGNWDDELLRAQLIEQVGAEQASTLFGDGTAASVVEPLAVGTPDLAAVAALLQRAGVTLSGPYADRGSNAWVVAGSQSESGRPLLENDPHLAPSMPSLWYEVGLHAPGLEVVGASLPGSPLVVIGHNAHIAWGVTTFPSDTQDLFVERVDEATGRYEWQGEQLPLVARTETVQVKGGEAVTFTVRETRHGPLLNDVVEGLSTPIAFQWRAAQQPTLLLDAVRLLNVAQDRADFLDALRLWHSPAQNFVYADDAGNIGYVVAGDLPIRPALGGVLPQPGWTGEAEWQGMVPFDELPQQWNPPSGFLVTANERPFDADFPYYAGDGWASPFRAERIAQMIEQHAPLSMDEVEAMQRDVLSLPAAKLVPLLVALPTDDIVLQRAQEQLAAWNQQVDGRLPGAAIYEVAHGFVVREMLADELGEVLLEGYLDETHRHLLLVQRLLDEPDHPLWDDTRTPQQEGRDAILLRALEASHHFLGRRFGDVPHEWFWDRLHGVPFAHPIGEQKPLDRLFNRTVPTGGDRATVNAIGYSYAVGYEANSIPSYRQIVDVGAWENSRMLHTTGQSGQPLHPHFDDMIARWLTADLAPMLWSDAQTQGAAQGRTLRLEP